ncbi:hypothetical protein, unlikely [Trypanosoma brucei gambiense DAL972]|uniref:Uncharacterized protein n=1 Tax=Trypanosoma brucei gambiense (strain MHOM/CI/86/DAL972) TaxID=679716 RepID=D0A2K6_TRYB9|nr:hypothetical protein, unlikely [Trypanosoma brucei gambiense DAL972]CBH15500.1 hypothetical protein, unlikely [Trypanosoma brucei gambiense DAL972]|eukprot:XP_011777764.1 hypothetical protein, unlikely [Trypanosoma brucei gambiense DAL972]
MCQNRGVFFLKILIIVLSFTPWRAASGRVLLPQCHSIYICVQTSVMTVHLVHRIYICLHSTPLRGSGIIFRYIASFPLSLSLWRTFIFVLYTPPVVICFSCILCVLKFHFVPFHVIE